MSLRIECIETTAFNAEQRRPKTRFQSTSERLFAGVPAAAKGRLGNRLSSGAIRDHHRQGYRRRYFVFRDA